MKAFQVITLFALVGCSSTSTVAGPPPVDSTPDSGTAAGSDSDSGSHSTSDAGGGGALDASTAQLGFRYHYEYAAPYKSTGDYCASSSYWGDACGPCSTGPAAPGVALAHSSAADTKLLSCADVPSGTSTSVAYCCVTPFIEVDAPVATPQSCTDVCTPKGLVCTKDAPVYDGSGGPVTAGSTIVRYENGAESTGWTYADCSAPPETTTSIQGVTYTLTQQTCECIDPRSPIPPHR